MATIRKRAKKASKKRTAKKRTTKKRTTKKRTTKKRATKKRTTKKRTTKKRATKKRATKKRATKKRATKSCVVKGRKRRVESLGAEELLIFINKDPKTRAERYELGAKLARRKIRGEYSIPAGKVSFSRLVNKAAKRYASRSTLPGSSRDWSRLFTAIDKRKASEILEKDFRSCYKSGAFDIRHRLAK